MRLLIQNQTESQVLLLTSQIMWLTTGPISTLLIMGNLLMKRVARNYLNLFLQPEAGERDWDYTLVESYAKLTMRCFTINRVVRRNVFELRSN